MDIIIKPCRPLSVVLFQWSGGLRFFMLQNKLQGCFSDFLFATVQQNSPPSSIFIIYYHNGKKKTFIVESGWMQ